MNIFYSILSLTPILVLLLVSLLKGVKAGIYSGFIITTILFFIWDSKLIAFPAALISAFINTISILMIVFGALLLHSNMEQVGFIEKIKNSLKKAHYNSSFQFYFLAFFLTAFFESVAGFGTPGAIVPLLLISLGYSPILSIVVVLLIDGLFAITGAIGTPVIAGFQGSLEIGILQVKLIYLYASCFMIISGAILLYFIQRFVVKEHPEISAYSWKLYFSIAIPFVLLSFFLRELTGVIASTFMGAFSFFFFFTNKKLDWKPWIPYGVLVVLLLVPKIITAIEPLISFKLSFNNMFNSDVNASFQPFRSPLFPFVIASFCAALLGKNHKMKFKPALKKTLSIFFILFPSLGITQLMLSSGTTMLSMIDTMSMLFAKTGNAYPLISPFIGLMGTFITGSTTVSNIIFGSVQYNSAENLNLSTELILAMQLNGASLGNAICLFNIISAAAVAGVDKYTKILNNNIGPILLATFTTSIIGFIILAII
ncbi:L-lactate permease [Polaribacter vadi]|uniref:L-lactate permease n=1 Tax=Polaribacter TaxID=52959 RepID=UPI001C09E22D|nr:MULTISPECIES: L-lactate permease [Polaribacter]MBU3012406.1 L-lactate permease [Polaribacter vadi]MDO6742223.1 L-lactate permease [Polaribacter sp. 1_MG-2023]